MINKKGSNSHLKIATEFNSLPLQIVVMGICVIGDCDCMQYDQLLVKDNQLPPFHEGCTCVAIEIGK